MSSSITRFRSNQKISLVWMQLFRLMLEWARKTLDLNGLVKTHSTRIKSANNSWWVVTGSVWTWFATITALILYKAFCNTFASKVLIAFFPNIPNGLYEVSLLQRYNGMDTWTQHFHKACCSRNNLCESVKVCLCWNNADPYLRLARRSPRITRKQRFEAGEILPRNALTPLATKKESRYVE